ncbi:MAG: hypothetical protein KCHDKBKB_01890 [Elusimicrobia bacterium]|nr:hypothetical protein [Elusimicrobiota bacterium]
MILAQVLGTILFVTHYQVHGGQPVLAWIFPLIILILIIINSIWFTRFSSWLIFSMAFFGFLVVLSAFTLRWRLQPDFQSAPFYRTLLMYVIFVYISLGQIKILGSTSWDKH